MEKVPANFCPKSRGWLTDEILSRYDQLRRQLLVFTGKFFLDRGPLLRHRIYWRMHVHILFVPAPVEKCAAGGFASHVDQIVIIHPDGNLRVPFTFFVVAVSDQTVVGLKSDIPTEAFGRQFRLQ